MKTIQASQKYYRQLAYADWKRRQLIEELYRILDDLEGRPVRRRQYNIFPLGILERAIQKGLIRFEDKFLRPYWKAQNKRWRR